MSLKRTGVARDIKGRTSGVTGEKSVERRVAIEQKGPCTTLASFSLGRLLHSLSYVPAHLNPMKQYARELIECSINL